MKTIQTFLALAALCFLSGCAATIVTRNNQAKITIPEGIVGQYPDPGQTVEWSGEKNEKGFANGPGTETWFGPDGNKVREVVLTYQNGTKNGPFTYRPFSHGKLEFEQTGTYANNIVVGEYKKRWFQPADSSATVYEEGYANAHGLLDGQVVSRKLNGERSVMQYSNGSQISSTTYNRDGTVKQAPVQQQTVSSSSSDDDDDILGAMIGLAGVAGGSADLTMAGVATMAGDKPAALNHLGNFATSTPGSTSASTPSVIPGNAGAIRSVSSRSRNVNGRNLVDSYGLGKYRNQHDHITHYLTAADEAHARYKQTGEQGYYDQHKEYADLAKEMHKQTATKGTRLAR